MSIATKRLTGFTRTLKQVKMPKNVLIVGATRGLGAALTAKYAAQQDTHIFATARSIVPSSPSGPNITWIPKIDVSAESVGEDLVKGIGSQKLSLVIVSAGYFTTESKFRPDYQEEVKMYKICAIGPTMLVSALARHNLLIPNESKIVLISTEGGSITLRHEKEGGAMYGHHASKTALNMVGKLFSLELKDQGIPVALVHPGFMKTDLTKSVGFDKYWEAAGAMTPDEAAQLLSDFIRDFDMSKTGQLWAVRGPGDIGTIEETVGPKDKLPTPLELPW